MFNANKAMWAVVSVVAVCSVLVCGKVYVDRRAQAAELAAAVVEVTPEVAPVEPEVSIEVTSTETAYQTVERDFLVAFKDSFKAAFFNKAHRMPSDELSDALAKASFEEVISFHFGKDKAENLKSNSPEWAKMATIPLSLELALKAISAEITIKFAKEGKAFAK